MIMPPDPNQLLAQANAASAQADAKADAARKMHAEADLAGQFEVTANNFVRDSGLDRLMKGAPSTLTPDTSRGRQRDEGTDVDHRARDRRPLPRPHGPGIRRGAGRHLRRPGGAGAGG